WPFSSNKKGLPISGDGERYFDSSFPLMKSFFPAETGSTAAARHSARTHPAVAVILIPCQYSRGTPGLQDAAGNFDLRRRRLAAMRLVAMRKDPKIMQPPRKVTRSGRSRPGSPAVT